MLPDRRLSWTVACLTALAAGCQSPYYADRGAAAGGLAGAGVGALIGNSVGNAGSGALIGAGVGALTGGAIGGALDEMQAQNRAEIAATLGRPVVGGAANVGEVVAMTQAGVEPQLIANYVETSGVAQPVSAQDVIYMSQQGVSANVIQTMQTPRVARVPAVVGPPPVMVEEIYYGPPPPYPPRHYYYYHHPRPRPRVGWGFTFSG